MCLYSPLVLFGVICVGYGRGKAAFISQSKEGSPTTHSPSSSSRSSGDWSAFYDYPIYSPSSSPLTIHNLSSLLLSKASSSPQHPSYSYPMAGTLLTILLSIIPPLSLLYVVLAHQRREAPLGVMVVGLLDVGWLSSLLPLLFFSYGTTSIIIKQVFLSFLIMI